MKQFLAFLGSTYYPRQAMGDFIGDFETRKEAIKFCREKCEKAFPPPLYKNDKERWELRFARVWDSEMRHNVWSKVGNEGE